MIILMTMFNNLKSGIHCVHIKKLTKLQNHNTCTHSREIILITQSLILQLTSRLRRKCYYSYFNFSYDYKSFL
jgi:hypothetical protein